MMDDQTKEILIILQEECAETIQATAKCFRFGPDQVYGEDTRTNIQRLECELGDLQAMIDLLIDQNVGVTAAGILDAKQHKFDKLKLWSNITIDK